MERIAKNERNRQWTGFFHVQLLHEYTERKKQNLHLHMYIAGKISTIYCWRPKAMIADHGRIKIHSKCPITVASNGGRSQKG